MFNYYTNNKSTYLIAFFQIYVDLIKSKIILNALIKKFNLIKFINK